MKPFILLSELTNIYWSVLLWNFSAKTAFAKTLKSTSHRDASAAWYLTIGCKRDVVWHLRSWSSLQAAFKSVYERIQTNCMNTSTLHLLVKPDYERVHCISVCTCVCADTITGNWPFMQIKIKQQVKMRTWKTTCSAVTLVLPYIHFNFFLNKGDQLCQTSKKLTMTIIHSSTQICNQAAEKTPQQKGTKINKWKKGNGACCLAWIWVGWGKMCIAQAIKHLFTCAKPGVGTFLPYPGYSEVVF